MGRDRRFSSETRPSRRDSTLRPSPVSIHPRSVCSPSIRDVPTPEPTETERSCTKVAGKLSELKCSKLCGRTSTMTGPRDPRQDCPSGSVSALARRLETQRLLRVRRKKWEAETAVPRKKRMKKRRKKKRNKKFLAQRDVIALMKIFQLDIVFLP